ncbi:MAG: hypothetical protein S4CHLAM20_11250 [Chlamydiia bacterium]|nr:hypothetical protein [Chlamydiia bacterium]
MIRNIFLLSFFFIFSIDLYSARKTKLRESSTPFISGDSFRTLADHICDETTKYKLDPKKVKDGDIIFINPDEDGLRRFFNHYHTQIRSSYIILTHNSDCDIPGVYYDYLNDPKILAWFGQNITGKPHLKLNSIPIGIANRCWHHGNISVFDAYLKKVRTQEKDIFCYVNINVGTYPKERGAIVNLFKKYSWAHNACSKPFIRYLDDMLRSKFVISPRGHGLDCHRTWEALLLGAIPVVKTSSLDILYKDLPVVIVDEWTDVTEEFLQEQYEILSKKKFNREKLFFKYWASRIR